MPGSLVLVRRRIRRDLAQVLGMAATVALVSLLALALPRMIAVSADEGAREAVSAAGRDADVVVQTLVGRSPTPTPTLDVDEAEALAEELPSLLPPGLAAVVDTATLTVEGPDLPIVVDGAAQAGVLTARIALAPPSAVQRLRVLAGELPVTAPQSMPQPSRSAASSALPASQHRSGSSASSPHLMAHRVLATRPGRTCRACGHRSSARAGAGLLRRTSPCSPTLTACTPSRGCSASR
jgi:putative ABC transport system permease protein